MTLLVVACTRPAEAPPAPESQSPTQTQAASAQVAASGDTLTVTTATGSASYTVGNLRQVPADAQIIPAKGSMYSVDVRIAGKSGVTIVNGFYFVARALDGSSIAPAVGAVRPGITSGQLAEGQTTEGVVAFDVPPGATIAAVVLRDPHGERLAAWSVG